jgi:hypothetical protein
MSRWKQSITFAALGVAILLTFVVIGFVIYVLAVIEWHPFSVFGPVVSVPLILGGLISRGKLWAAWSGVAFLMLWGGLFLFSVGIPFLVTGVLLIIPLAVITVARGKNANIVGVEMDRGGQTT